MEFVNQFLQGNCIDVLKQLPDQSVDMCVTSPPYYGLRDYQVDGQIGLEETPEQFISKLVDVFREVRRVLKDDGTLWVNIGDSYNGSNKAGNPNSEYAKRHTAFNKPLDKQYHGIPIKVAGLKPKDLIGIPWMLAFALRTDGWYLRQDIIWCISGGAWVYAKSKKKVMPIMIKDLMRLDLSTVKLWNGKKWTRILGAGRSDNPQNKIEFVLRSGERIGSTGEHIWPTHRGNVCAAELKVGDIIQTCQLPEPDDANCPEYMTDDLFWFIGLYLAEGSRSDDTIQITGHSKEVSRLERIQRLAKYYGGSMTKTVIGNTMNIRIYSRILNAVIDDYISGKVAKNKGMSTKTWSLPNHALVCIMNGYLSGDGHNDIANKRYRLGFTRNYNLERDLRIMASRLGAIMTLNTSFSKNKTKTFPSFRGEWRWSRSGHGNERDRGEIVAIRRSRARQFWDISVEDDPHLFSLASGVLTHNCKPNPQPESVTDRCTKAHEYIFLLSKKQKYYYDAASIRQEGKNPKDDFRRLYQQKFGNKSVPDKMKGGLRPRGHRREHSGFKEWDMLTKEEQQSFGANKRSVWSVATKPYRGAHFAVFPEELILPCILAGCPENGIVLDPFMGSGTTALVSLKNNRKFVGIELNPEYIDIAKNRIQLWDYSDEHF